MPHEGAKKKGKKKTNLVESTDNNKGFETVDWGFIREKNLES